MASFPTQPDEKRALNQLLKTAVPDLMADIAAIRAQVPTARVTYIKFTADGTEHEYGERADMTNAHDITPIADRVDEATARRKREALRKEQARKEALRRDRAKRAHNGK